MNRFFSALMAHGKYPVESPQYALTFKSTK